MDSSQDLVEAFRKGYHDGWTSVSGSGAAPSIPMVSAHFLIEGKSRYESGYERGRTAAAQGKPHA
jgi:hypothetical protein